MVVHVEAAGTPRSGAAHNIGICCGHFAIRNQHSALARPVT